MIEFWSIIVLSAAVFGLMKINFDKDRIFNIFLCLLFSIGFLIYCNSSVIPHTKTELQRSFPEVTAPQATIAFFVFIFLWYLFVKLSNNFNLFDDLKSYWSKKREYKLNHLLKLQEIEINHVKIINDIQATEALAKAKESVLKTQAWNDLVSMPTKFSLEEDKVKDEDQ